MVTSLFIVIAILSGALALTYFLKRRAEARVAAAEQNAANALHQRDAEVAQARAEAAAAIANTQSVYEQKETELSTEAERVREHYEAEARKIADEADARVAELEPLKAYAALKDAESEVQKVLSDAMVEATTLRTEAQGLLDRARAASSEERIRAQQQVKEIHDQANALLSQATRDAGRIVAEAEKRAEQIGGEAYTALRDKQILEQAAAAMRNIIEGYGDRYIVPTHSLLDDLAAEFGYDAAGVALKNARDQSRRMVEQGEAAVIMLKRTEEQLRFGL